MKYEAECYEALDKLHAGLSRRGLRVVPIQPDGRLARSAAKLHGLLWLRPDGEIRPILTADGIEGVPRLHNLQIGTYLGPPTRNEPYIYCYHIDHYAVGMTGKLYRNVQQELGIPTRATIRGGPCDGRVFGYQASCEANGPYNTELYLLTSELLGFAEWLPEWVEALEQRRPLPAPPYALYGGGEVWYYKWSWAAMATYRAWEGIVESSREVPRGARPPPGVN